MKIYIGLCIIVVLAHTFNCECRANYLDAEGEAAYQRFLKEAEQCWIQRLNTKRSYSYSFDLARRNEGVKDPGGNAIVKLKRLSGTRLFESLSTSTPSNSRVFATNNDYSFGLRSTDGRSWFIDTIGSKWELEKPLPFEDGGESIRQEYTNTIFHPDYEHYTIASTIPIDRIPWTDTSLVRLVSARMIDPTSNEIAEFSFDFHFDDSHSFPGVRWKPIEFRKLTIRFKTQNWEPLYSDLTQASGAYDEPVTIRFIQTANLGTDGRLESLKRELVFTGPTTNVTSTIDFTHFQRFGKPSTNEFRLPHYGLPDYKSSSRWSNLWIGLGLMLFFISCYLLAKSRLMDRRT